MSTTNATPSEAMQHLIDLRLDAIDRALLGLLPRNDRLATVAQVETRIRELTTADSAAEAIQQRHPEHAKLDDLARLGEGAEGAVFPSALQPSTPASGRTTSSSRSKRSRLALSSGVLGIVALVLLFTSPFAYMVIATLGANEIVDEIVAMLLLGTLVAVVAIGGTAAVILGIVALVRLNRNAGRLFGHGWAITGLCTGPLPMLAGGLIGLIAGMQTLAMESVSVVGVQTAAVPGEYMAAPEYAPPSAGACLPPSYPESPPMGPPSYAPAGYPSAPAEADVPRTRLAQPAEPEPDAAPEARSEAAPASLPPAPATPASGGIRTAPDDGAPASPPTSPAAPAPQSSPAPTDLE